MEKGMSSLEIISRADAIEMIAIVCVTIVLVVVVAMVALALAAVAWSWSNGVLGDPRAARELLDRRQSRRGLERGVYVARPVSISADQIFDLPEMPSDKDSARAKRSRGLPPPLR